MAICLDLLLVAERYDAGGGQNPREEEWPPHPGRVFAALRAVAEDGDLSTLRALEALPPPVIRAASETSPGGTRTYVVTNVREGKGGNLNHPGRTSGMRQRRTVFPGSPRVQMVWVDEGTLDRTDLGRLDSMARKVPYLGRSTSPVLMGVQRYEGEPPVPEGLATLHPSEAGSTRLRVPYPGYLDELDALHQLGLPAWQASEGPQAWHGYATSVEAQEQPDEIVSPYRDLVVLRFKDRRPAGNTIPVFAAALRSMVMSQTANPLPPALHGHGFDGNPHVAYLGLPFCGAPHADGHLVALAIAVPGMSEGERQRILRGILGSESGHTVMLRVPGYRDAFTLEYKPGERLPRTANPSFWASQSRHWVSATPIVLDRYPKNGDLAQSVADSVVLAGLPRPALVEVSTEAMTTGAVRLSPRELPRRARGRLFCHARLSFDSPVAGPLLVGAGRYFGVGLLQPERHIQGGEHASA